MIAIDLIANKVDPAPAAEAKLIAPIEDVSTPNIPAIATPTIAPENIRRNVLRFRVIFFSLKVSGSSKARAFCFTQPCYAMFETANLQLNSMELAGNDRNFQQEKTTWCHYDSNSPLIPRISRHDLNTPIFVARDIFTKKNLPKTKKAGPIGQLSHWCPLQQLNTVL